MRKLNRVSKLGLQTAQLFPDYTFVRVELQWHIARWAPGVAAMVMNGE